MKTSTLRSRLVQSGFARCDAQRHRRAAACLALLAAAATAWSSQAAQPSPSIIRDVTVIAGDGSPPLANRAVTVRAGHIESVQPDDEVVLPAGADVVDGTGRYLVPGFVDTHAHVAIGPVSLELEDGAPVFTMSPVASVAEATSRSLLAHGVTLARDPGGPDLHTVAARRQIADAAVPGPTLQVAGPVIDTSRFENLAATVSTPDEVRAEVARQADAGVDWIKLYVGLTPDLVAAAVDEAHRHGLKVTGHLQATTWTQAAGLGIDSIVHAIPGSAELLPEETRADYAASMTSTLHMLRWFDLVDRDALVIDQMIRALRDHNVSVDPTLVVFHSMAHGDRPEYTANPHLNLVPAALVENWRTLFNFNVGWTSGDYATARALYPQAAAFTRHLFEAGVTLTAGTDANNPWIVPGDSYHTELALLVAAGIPPLHVLTIATRNGAQALGVLEQTGTVKAGKRADLVLLARDPTKDISATREVVWVMKGGSRYRPEDLEVARRRGHRDQAGPGTAWRPLRDEVLAASLR